jgi:hypothetical protein
MWTDGKERELSKLQLAFKDLLGGSSTIGGYLQTDPLSTGSVSIGRYLQTEPLSHADGPGPYAYAKPQPTRLAGPWAPIAGRISPPFGQAVPPRKMWEDSGAGSESPPNEDPFEVAKKHKRELQEHQAAVRALERELGRRLYDDEWQRLHREINRQDLRYHGIIEAGRNFFGGGRGPTWNGRRGGGRNAPGGGGGFGPGSVGSPPVFLPPWD